ncbi:hypothetical protein RCH21_002424 [Arthrobacter sp. PL16]|uniref:hypothetical protein n=1 Tax=Arthrobacter sp. PL16 TaxID=3071720 RepID=UPI002E0BAF0A|nr:hypothetical protein [Arthrobacter sp. PL16]
MKRINASIIITALAAFIAGVLVTLAIVAPLLAPSGAPPVASTNDDGAQAAPPTATAFPTPAQATLAPRATATSESGNGDDKTEEPDDEENEEPITAPGIEAQAQPGQADLPDYRKLECPAATQQVATSAELADALESAAPGDVIRLADGVYAGPFVARSSGTAVERIFLCGGRGAVLDGGSIKGGYVLHLDQAEHWALIGFTVRNGQKGVMADATTGTFIQDLAVTGIGDEAIHLRNNSTANVVLNNTISNTGLRKPKFGEGVYIGSAESNWCTVTECLPDRSDRNVIAGNTISGTTSESIDVKEGTVNGLIIDNTFDGSDLSGADSWVDVKGTAWTITGNRGENTPLDGFQTHEIIDGWGTRNLFADNTAIVNGAGHAIATRPERANIVDCANLVENAGEGLTNADCR